MENSPGVYGRKPYFERESTCESISYVGSSVAPHAKTERASYLIPVGKMVKLDMLDADIDRVSVSSDDAEASIEFIIIDTDLNEVLLHKSVMINKSINAHSDHEHDSNLFCNNGASLVIYTTDLSASGTITYTASLLFQLFNK